MSTTTDQTSTDTSHSSAVHDAASTTAPDAPHTLGAPQPRSARRPWMDSPVLVGVVALMAGGLVAVAVAAIVVVVTRPTPLAATSTPVVATMEGPSTGDARQGLTADSATRRLGGSSPFYVPDSADSALRRAAAANAGLYAWDSADSADARALVVALLEHDSADSADRRAMTEATGSDVVPDSADSAARRGAAPSSPSSGDARTGLTPDSATRR